MPGPGAAARGVVEGASPSETRAGTRRASRPMPAMPRSRSPENASSASCSSPGAPACARARRERCAARCAAHHARRALRFGAPARNVAALVAGGDARARGRRRVRLRLERQRRGGRGAADARSHALLPARTGTADARGCGGGRAGVGRRTRLDPGRAPQLAAGAAASCSAFAVASPPAGARRTSSIAGAANRSRSSSCRTPCAAVRMSIKSSGTSATKRSSGRRAIAPTWCCRMAPTDVAPVVGYFKTQVR